MLRAALVGLIVVFANDARATPLTRIERRTVDAAVRVFAPHVDQQTLRDIHQYLAHAPLPLPLGRPDQILNRLGSRVAHAVRSATTDARAGRVVNDQRLVDIVRDLVWAHRLAAGRAWLGPVDERWTVPGATLVRDYRRVRAELPRFQAHLARLLASELGHSRLARDAGARTVLMGVRLLVRTVWSEPVVEGACGRLLAPNPTEAPSAT